MKFYLTHIRRSVVANSNSSSSSRDATGCYTVSAILQLLQLEVLGPTADARRISCSRSHRV
jgi:hypothetical protein